MKKKHFRLPILTIIILQLVSISVNAIELRDTYPDTWVAVDALERKTPVNGETSKPNDKKVGIFYFLWHTKEGTQNIYDHTKTYNEGGVDAIWNVIKQGPLGYPHYWAKPYFGYYRSDDEWIIRKHAFQLSNAGVDFIYFDVSNGVMYEKEYKVLLGVWEQIRKEGGNTPQFIFFCGDNADIGKTDMNTAWKTIYEDERYKDLWFMWEGKPLILGNFSKVEQEKKDFFTIRRSWAFNSWTGDGIEKWPWLADYPQKPGRNIDGVVEQMIVSCGFHATTSKGRSYTNGKQPTDGKNAFEFELETTPLGLAFDEQWEEAIKINPPLIMITGWNEWTAGRWENSDAGMKMANTYIIKKDDPQYKHFYVDCFNEEFSRDTEPMKGGFGDNYYYQMVSWIRKYKGVRDIPVENVNLTINIEDDFSVWDNVSIEYRDTLYDTLHRNKKSNGGADIYKNESGRNDFDYAKVSRDSENIYFMAATRDRITDPEGTNWMNLYINSDQNYSTGWHGYDYVINSSQTNGYVSVEKFINNSWDFEKIGEAKYKVNDNKIMISVPRNLLNIDKNKSFDFKWADNSTINGEIMQFMDLGDAAPDDRFNFRYIDKYSDPVHPIIKVNRFNLLLIIAIVEAVIAGTFIYLTIRELKRRNIAKSNN